MADFKRALGVSLAVIILVLTAVLAFALINENIAGSGFSSGEVLFIEFENMVFSGEIMGEEFSVDFSPAAEYLPILEKMSLLLSPCSRLLLRVLYAVF